MDTSINPAVFGQLGEEWNLSIPEHCTEDQLRDILATEINRLILHDFPRLISLLYRIDIPETRLKQMLRDNTGTDAGSIIAVMILERQKEKQRLRAMFKASPSDSDEERW